MKDYLNITQLARMRNVTTETLRHYDRIGLLKPDFVNPDNGYRYYSMEQIEKFDTIVDLRNIGMSLKEISEFIRTRNIEQSYILLSRLEQEMREEIERKERLHLQVQQKLAYMESIKIKDYPAHENWHIKKYGDRKVVISDVDQEDVYHFFYEFTRLRENCENNYIVFGTNFVGSLISPDSFLDKDVKRLERFPAIPEGICKERISYGKVVTLPGGEYLCCYGKGVLQAGSKIIANVKNYLEENGYNICGFLYEREIVDISMTNQKDEMTYQLEIPIKKF